MTGEASGYILVNASHKLLNHCPIHKLMTPGITKVVSPRYVGARLEQAKTDVKWEALYKYT